MPAACSSSEGLTTAGLRIPLRPDALGESHANPDAHRPRRVEVDHRGLPLEASSSAVEADRGNDCARTMAARAPRGTCHRAPYRRRRSSPETSPIRGRPGPWPDRLSAARAAVDRTGGVDVATPDPGSPGLGGDEAAIVPATTIEPITSPIHTIPRRPTCRIRLIAGSSQ